MRGSSSGNFYKRPVLQSVCLYKLHFLFKLKTQQSPDKIGRSADKPLSLVYFFATDEQASHEKAHETCDTLARRHCEEQATRV
jgi:hypothetical protein